MNWNVKHMMIFKLVKVVPHYYLYHTMTENDAICSMISGNSTLTWPNIINQPINEFQTSGLATQAFPTLFPYGTGDPTCLG